MSEFAITKHLSFSTSTLGLNNNSFYRSWEKFKGVSQGYRLIASDCYSFPMVGSGREPSESLFCDSIFMLCRTFESGFEVQHGYPPSMRKSETNIFIFVIWFLKKLEKKSFFCWDFYIDFFEKNNNNKICKTYYFFRFFLFFSKKSI